MDFKLLMINIGNNRNCSIIESLESRRESFGMAQSNGCNTRYVFKSMSDFFCHSGQYSLVVIVFAASAQLIWSNRMVFGFEEVAQD